MASSDECTPLTCLSDYSSLFLIVDATLLALMAVDVTLLAYGAAYQLTSLLLTQALLSADPIPSYPFLSLLRHLNISTFFPPDPVCKHMKVFADSCDGPQDEGYSAMTLVLLKFSLYCEA